MLMLELKHVLMGLPVARIYAVTIVWCILLNATLTPGVVCDSTLLLHVLS